MVMTKAIMAFRAIT